MRRALRSLALGALVVALVAAGSGIELLSRLGSATGDHAIADVLGGAPRVAHAVVGHAAVGLACIVAAMAFVLGLQGLLEAGGRKGPATVLFILGPAVMALALAAEFSGHVDPDLTHGGFLAVQLGKIAREHALVVAPSLGLSLLAIAAIAILLLRQGGRAT